MRVARMASRNWGFLLALVLAAWAGLEVGGKGTGVLHWLFAPGVTREQGFHPLDLFGARPKGPMRLTLAEANAVDARLAAAFAGGVPAHRRLSAMREYYALQAGARCATERPELAECNKVERVDDFFAALLGAMHPATEHLLLVERKTEAGGPGRSQLVQVASFVGLDGKARLAFDLRRVKRAASINAFTVRTYDRASLRDLPARDAGGVLIVDDPGILDMPKERAGGIFIYAGTDPPANMIIGLLLDGALAVRHQFLSAVIGKTVSADRIGTEVKE